MTMRDFSPEFQPTRRSALGLLGAVPLAVGALPALSGPASATGGGDVPEDLRPGGSYDRLLGELAARDEFSGTVLFAHRGRPVLFRSHGMANRQRSIPIHRNTRFKIASVGKMFTGVAVTQLAAADKLHFHDPIGTYLDGFSAEIADKVNVHHLLTHTAGLGDFQTDPDYPGAGAQWTTPEEAFEGTMAIIRKQQTPLFVPGSDNKYSNSGFYTLGAILAKAANQPSYWDYVREHIFAPAEMHDTDFYYTVPNWRTDGDFAHRYGDPGPDGQRPDLNEQPDVFQEEFGGGAGGGFSTAPDLLRFGLALQRFELLGRAFVELMGTGKFPPVPQDSGRADPSATISMTAYGCVATIINGHRKFGHGGGAAGVNVSLAIYPDLDWVAIILSNYSLASMNSLIQLQDQLITQS